MSEIGKSPTSGRGAATYSMSRLTGEEAMTERDLIAKLRETLETLMNQPTMNPLAMTAKQRQALWDAHAKAREVLSLPIPSPASQEEWRPVESAPRDGSVVDLWCCSPGISGVGGERVPECWFSANQWWRYDDYGDDQCRSPVYNVTHWQPLPAPPAALKESTHG